MELKKKKDGKSFCVTRFSMKSDLNYNEQKSSYFEFIFIIVYYILWMKNTSCTESTNS